MSGIAAALLSGGRRRAPGRPADELRSGDRRRRRLRRRDARRVPRARSKPSAPGSTAACTGRPASSGRSSTSRRKRAGIRATGIGCFFDDLTHRVFGLTGDDFQVLYHFTMGGPVDDPACRPIRRTSTSRVYVIDVMDSGADFSVLLLVKNFPEQQIRSSSSPLLKAVM